MDLEFGGNLPGAAIIALAAFSILLTGGLWPGDSSLADDELRTTILQVEGAPVAVITPIPDVVSNGTKLVLIASDSYDDDGEITTYQWELENGANISYVYGETARYRFSITGLYKITLTVTDNDGKRGVAFTAVYSVPDSDVDGIADWWEIKYFGDLLETASGDPDGDGYSNLEEYVRDTNPLVADPAEGLIEANWKLFLAGGAAAAVVVAVLYPRRRRKRKESERKKMELAIEIQKALDEE